MIDKPTERKATGGDVERSSKTQTSIPWAMKNSIASGHASNANLMDCWKCRLAERCVIPPMELRSFVHRLLFFTLMVSSYSC